MVFPIDRTRNEMLAKAVDVWDADTRGYRRSVQERKAELFSETMDCRLIMGNKMNSKRLKHEYDTHTHTHTMFPA